ncbi:transposase [Oscillatoria sp. FACHB-1407]|uniref:transposase n=1 Tax=Oscillatoria sp. FACHB-1407 TaxID=2692847 RepID=UPI00168348F6|nr:transposase [Oscillatoria sp. FACHB-1407]
METEAQSPPTEEINSSKRRNSRNGYSAKTVKADCGELALETPRDRDSTFELILVPKGERMTALPHTARRNPLESWGRACK